MSKALPISDIAITLLLSKPEGNYTRAGQIANPAFFWINRASDQKAITNIDIIHGDIAAVPSGYIKLTESLTSSGPTVYVCVEKGGKSSSSSPVLDFKILSGDSVPGPGFHKLPQVLNPDAPKSVPREYIAIKSEATVANLNNKEYTIGDMIDVLDTR